jgi:hypothetical protein
MNDVLRTLERIRSISVIEWMLQLKIVSMMAMKLTRNVKMVYAEQVHKKLVYGL